MAKERTYIYGKHAVAEAVQYAPHAVDTVFLAPSISDEGLRNAIRAGGIKMAKLSPQLLPEEVLETAVHQGIAAEILPDKLVREYDDFVNGLEVGPDTSLVILGEVQDPQNVGAIIRSAAAFGIKGVLMPEHNQAPVTGTVVKVSAGMAFHVPLVRIGNVNNTVRDLKERGFWIYGLEGEGKNDLTQETFDAPAVFILGNESKGIRLKTRELCDILLSIPTHPQCESLNVAASAAVTLYAWGAQHPAAHTPTREE